MGPGHIVVVSQAEDVRAEVASVLVTCGLTGVVSLPCLELDDDIPPPALIVVCGPEPALLCAEAREVPQLAKVPILAFVPRMPKVAAATVLAAGATDIVAGDRHPAVLGARVRRMLAHQSSEEVSRELEHLERSLLRIQTLIAEGGDAPETLRQVLLVALETVHYDRASLIAHVEGSQHGYVIAATDDPNLQQFTLLMSDYPELHAALTTREPLIAMDVEEHPVTSPIAPRLLERGVGSIGVLPLVWRGSPLGAVFFRSAEPVDREPDARKIRFGLLLATQLAGLLRHGSVMERLRDQTRRISRASYEAERRLRTIESLKEHFEASADGVVVLDGEGRMLFVNGTAEAITGWARDGLIGSALTDLVPPDDRESLEIVIRSVLAGTNLEAFDLDLITTGGNTICVSVTTSTVLSRSEAVILSFRDVTAQRALEAELEQTKDFLEKLIDSTVDAIIASDMNGRIVLFNSGAERIYGYSAEEVLGRLDVAELYPEGMAAQVLRMLRSPDYGGVGKLEQTRREIMTKAGELVPVRMTASIVYEEENQEAATVGIFTDLRDRIRMEQRLLATQRQLREREKQAAIAELAGAAAHELNQPLTSILATASMLARELGPDAPSARRVDTIVAEAERMAEQVRKVGRITRYETKEYIGSANILDLERSSREHTDTADQVIPPDEPLEEGGEPPVTLPQDELPGPFEVEKDEITQQHRLPNSARASAQTVSLRTLDLPEEPS